MRFQFTDEQFANACGNGSSALSHMKSESMLSRSILEEEIRLKGNKLMSHSFDSMIVLVGKAVSFVLKLESFALCLICVYSNEYEQ